MQSKTWSIFAFWLISRRSLHAFWKLFTRMRRCISTTPPHISINCLTSVQIFRCICIKVLYWKCVNVIWKVRRQIFFVKRQGLSFSMRQSTQFRNGDVKRPKGVIHCGCVCLSYIDTESEVRVSAMGAVSIHLSHAKTTLSTVAPGAEAYFLMTFLAIVFVFVYNPIKVTACFSERLMFI